jgi:hypothetical protein
METLDTKCARLSHDLQDAYDNWVRTSEPGGGPRAVMVSRDISGCSGGDRPEWFAYLAAKQRLVLAYAERTEASRNDR